MNKKVTKKTRVALAHSCAPFLDRDAAVAKACDIIQEASNEGARLIVFPETYLPGYPYWIWSHTASQSKSLFAELFDNSIEIGDESSNKIANAAKKAGAWVVMGMNEREGGTLYNTLVYYSPEGRVVACHRKLQPTNSERTVWGRGDGRSVFVIDADIGRLGGLICYEHTMDLNRYALTSLGEQIHIAVWPGASANKASGNWDNFDNITEAAVKYHALAAQAFVICVQGRIDRSVLDKLGFLDQPDIMREGGGLSGIVAPNANWIVGPHRDAEKILYGTIDLGMIPYAKFFADSAGHYARPDIFEFAINTSDTTTPARIFGQADANALIIGHDASDQAADDAPKVDSKLIRP